MNNRCLFENRAACLRFPYRRSAGPNRELFRPDALETEWYPEDWMNKGGKRA